MIKGIFIFEVGGVQQIGDLNSAQGIINTIKELLPQLEAQELKRITDNLSAIDLEKLIEVHKNKTAAENK